jgi:2,3-bisphosphoglycerate-dependent phosphoglycerate mutase
MYKLVLLRHGQSLLNKANKFAGWTDKDNGLSELGYMEAKKAGEELKKEGYVFDVAYVSRLSRAKETLRVVMEEMGENIPTKESWRLNERHYGVLQELNRVEAVEKYGEEQVALWRRSYDVPPPPVEESDYRFPGQDELYSDVPGNLLPKGESLEDVIGRVLPYWESDIAPDIKSGKRVIISAHGNSLRALVKYLDEMPSEDIANLNIPTGIPLVYELDENLKPLRHYYLASEEELQAAVDKVANQTKK